MNKCLMTGSSGFIGTHLTKALRNKNVEVVEFDRKNGFDVTKKESFKKLNKVDVVFHLAAVSGYANSNVDINRVYQTNYMGVVNVLEYCRQVKAKLIFPSTYVYDKPYTKVKKETDPTNPATNYAFTKYLGERLCLFYNRVFKVETVILRTSNVYGNGQDKIYLIPVIKKHLLENKLLTLTRPEVERSFIYVDDLVEAYIKIAESEVVGGEIFNVGPERSTTLSELVELMGKNVNITPKVTYSGKDRPNEVDINRVDINKIKSAIDWVPKIDLKVGLNKIKQPIDR